MLEHENYFIFMQFYLDNPWGRGIHLSFFFHFINLHAQKSGCSILYEMFVAIKRGQTTPPPPTQPTWLNSYDLLRQELNMIISFSVIISRHDTTFALFLASSIISAKKKCRTKYYE